MLTDAPRAELPIACRAAWQVASAIALLLCAFSSVAHADDPRSTYLIKLLQSSSQFRVRAQAAISLGSVEGSSAGVDALVSALRDTHPAVRAAAATSLGRVGNPSTLAMLRTLERDPEEPVRAAARKSVTQLQSSAPGPEELPPPSGPPLYYVSVAMPATQIGELDKRVLEEARDFIKARVQQISGVRLAPDAESSQAAEKVLKAQKLKGFYLNSSITKLEKKPSGETRVAVSMIVATYPGRDMRAITNGAATVSGGGSQTYHQAVEGALSGVMRGLPQAFANTR